MSEPRDWLIVEGHTGLFWCDDSKGYGRLEKAGLYTEAEAKRIHSRPNDSRRDRAVHISEYRDQIVAMKAQADRMVDVLNGATT